MQLNFLNTLREKPVYAAAVRYIDKLLAGGVPLDNIQVSNFENRKGMTQGVIKGGANAGKLNGKYENRHVIVIPRGTDSDASKWKKYNDFRDRNVVEAIEVAGPVVTREADGPQVVTVKRTSVNSFELLAKAIPAIMGPR